MSVSEGTAAAAAEAAQHTKGSKRKVEEVLHEEEESVAPTWMKRAKVIPSQSARQLAEFALDARVSATLREMGVERLFPVQEQVVPVVMKAHLISDVLVSAPTGSGKTLCYVLPIVQSLSSRVVTRLRALVVVPTRDLAIQVRSVFAPFCKRLGLRVGCAIGQRSFAYEQELLVGEGGAARHGGQSRVDIVVATPGRLSDHLDGTPGFTLQHLRFLVIDEADRLLNQPYQDWIARVYESAQTAQRGRWLHDPLVADATAARCTYQKLLFSATLTRDPQKLANLRLQNPVLFGAGSAEKQYVIPEELEQFIAVCDLEEKPLVLLAVLRGLRARHAVCFTRSVDATHRLCQLLEAFGRVRVAEYSSLMSQEDRTYVLQQFKSGAVELLVSSDAMARGFDMDLLDVVVNYDVPTNVGVYVHRVGRTARAGNKGVAVTLLERKQVRYFKDMIKQAQNGHAKNFVIKKDALRAMLPRYKEALRVMRGEGDEEEEEEGDWEDEEV